MDIARALDRIVPAAQYGGAFEANSQAEYDAIRWTDARAKPSWRELVDAFDASLLEEARAAKRAVIEAERDKRLSAGFAWGGKTFQCDHASWTRITLAATGHVTNQGLGVAFPGQTWRAADNTDASITTLADMIAFAQAAAVFYEAHMRASHAHKDAIAALPTASQVRAYDATEGWPE